MRRLIIVNNPKDWDFHIDGTEIVSAKSYLINNSFSEINNARVYNLCNNFRYQSIGYYVSLIAEARGHRAIPRVTTIQDMKSRSYVRLISDDLDESIQKSLSHIKSKQFTLSIYFGKNLNNRYEKLANQLTNLFSSPLLRVNFIFNKKWSLQSVSPISMNEIPKHHKPFLLEFAKIFLNRRQLTYNRPDKTIYDLAILVDPNAGLYKSPSDKIAIKRFMRAANELDFNTDLITKDDFSRIAEYDALFIRETTAVNHYTYRFSRRAQKEGLIVIDDPVSILKCSNKVYLAEMLSKKKIPIPKTLTIHKDNLDIIETTLGFPCVLKRPDSSYSQGVIKVNNKEQLKTELEEIFNFSDLVIAQEFIKTDFDWRIGVLDNKPLFACKYFMAKDHWQVFNWKGNGKIYGGWESIPMNDAPACVVKNALLASTMIGDGFYGVDLKESGTGAVVMEVNDNPSVESDVEDGILNEELYRTVLRSFKNRLDKSKAPRTR